MTKINKFIVLIFIILTGCSQSLITSYQNELSIKKYPTELISIGLVDGREIKFEIANRTGYRLQDNSIIIIENKEFKEEIAYSEISTYRVKITENIEKKGSNSLLWGTITGLVIIIALVLAIPIRFS